MAWRALERRYEEPSMISEQLSARVINRLASALGGKRTFSRRAHPLDRHRNRRNRHLLTVINAPTA